MARTEGHILADMLDQTRQLTRYYISNLKTVDPYTRVESGDKTFNSIYWLVAHLIWAEDNLVMVGSTGKSIAPEWISHYHLGSDGSMHEGHGDFKSLLYEMKQVHEQIVAHIRSLSDEQLEDENSMGLGFNGNDKSIRMLIMHAIRHEGTHIGHLGWICKMKDLSVI